MACLSKTLATVLTYPYTVIRTFQHLSQTKKPLKDILKEIYEDGGLVRFFKGSFKFERRNDPEAHPDGVEFSFDAGALRAVV